MKRILGSAIATLLFALTGGIAQPAGAHTTSEVLAVCKWFYAYYFTPNPGVTLDGYVPVAWWGSQQAWCRYRSGTGSIVFLYDIRSGASAWIDLNWYTYEQAPAPSH
jgi:hypothetical protein